MELKEHNSEIRDADTNGKRRSVDLTHPLVAGNLFSDRWLVGGYTRDALPSPLSPPHSLTHFIIPPPLLFSDPFPLTSQPSPSPLHLLFSPLPIPTFSYLYLRLSLPFITHTLNVKPPPHTFLPAPVPSFIPPFLPPPFITDTLMLATQSLLAATLS